MQAETVVPQPATLPKNTGKVMVRPSVPLPKGAGKAERLRHFRAGGMPPFALWRYAVVPT